MEHVAERVGELGVRHRRRRREVDGADDVDDSRWAIAPTSSSIEIQLCHCVPEPILLPSPSLNNGNCFFSAPPSADSTMPVRRWTTRVPADSAGAVAASHSRTGR